MVFKVCDTLLKLNSSMLGADYSDKENAKNFQNAVVPVLTTLALVLSSILSVVAVGWAVWCAIGMMRANSSEKRDNQKKRLIYSIIAVFVTLLAVAILIYVQKSLPTWLGKGDTFKPQ